MVAGFTTTSSAAEAIAVTVLGDSVLHELRPAQFMRSHFRMARFTGESPSYDFLLNDPSTTNSPILDPTLTEATVGIDGTQFTAREYQTDKARATAAVVGMMGAIGDFTKAVTAIDLQGEISGALARTLAHKFEKDACLNLANFSNVTTAASGQFTYDDLLAAVSAMEQRDVTATYVFGGNPKQLADVRADIAGRTGEVFGKPGNDLQGHYRESWGSLIGTNLFASTAVASASGNYTGAVFADQEALGLLEAWAPKFELFREPRALSTYVVVSMAYGMCEVSDVRGQSVVSSAS